MSLAVAGALLHAQTVSAQLAACDGVANARLEAVDLRDALGTKTPLILIHGINLNGVPAPPTPEIWDNFIAYYETKNQNFKDSYKLYRFSYSSNAVSVAELATCLRDDIDGLSAEDPANFGSKPIAILAHSMGGLIARQFMFIHLTQGAFADRRAADRVLRLITLATPHHGSPGANGPALEARVLASDPLLGTLLSAYNAWLFPSNAPTWAQLNRSDLRWDNYDALLDYSSFPDERNDQLTVLNADSTWDQKIVAYGGQLPSLPMCSPHGDYCMGSTLLGDGLGLPSDGIVPVSSAFLYTRSGKPRAGLSRTWDDYDHSQLWRGKGDDLLFNQIAFDLMPVSGLRATQRVAAGGNHTCALTSAGTVSCWGSNTFGQLGNGTTTSQSTPISVNGLGTGVIALAAGESHTCALTSAGAVWCWGMNLYGQLGDGTINDRHTPVEVNGLQGGAVALTAGIGHTCALKVGGAVVCWGANTYGQVGDGTTSNRLTPVAVGGLTGGVVALAAGYYHTCAVTSGGAVSCWGSNNSGQIGDGTVNINRFAPVSVSGLTSGVVALAAGGAHTCAVTGGGAVRCWGYNLDGQLGDGTITRRLAPVAVNGMENGIVALTAGYFHTCAVTDGGTMRCWGNNGQGQLGDGTTTGRLTAVEVAGLSSAANGFAAGQFHTCALITAGAVRCWGYNAFGQLGDGSTTNRVAPAAVGRFGRSFPGDFDGDRRADIAVYRPSSGTWFSLDSSNGNSSYRHRGWGVQAQGDVPAPGDYDGDGLIDPTVFRPAVGTWFILESHANYTTWDWFGWGNATDTLVPGDYDVDGKTDAAVYRASTGTWYVRPSSGATPWNVVFGEADDVPIAGDFDGDGKRDPAVYRPASGTWFWLKSSTNFTTYDYRGWGVQAQGDVPVPGDYDGDGTTDLCVFRPASGTWFILESHAGWTTWNWFGWGGSADTLVPADYDGDGKTDAAIYRASTGEWFVRPSSGATPWNVVFGQAGDVPIK